MFPTTFTHHEASRYPWSGPCVVADAACLFLLDRSVERQGGPESRESDRPGTAAQIALGKDKAGNHPS